MVMLLLCSGGDSPPTMLISIWVERVAMGEETELGRLVDEGKVFGLGTGLVGG